MKSYLSYPDNYDEKKAKRISNGCGPKGWKFDIIADHLLWISIKEPCDIHDLDFYNGGDMVAFIDANYRYLKNMLLTIDRESRWWNSFLNPKRRALAHVYHEAVCTKYAERNFNFHK